MSDSPPTGLDLLLHPGQIMINLMITLLTPLFLTSANCDIGLARMAAAHTVETYRAETNADLLVIAKIIAFGLAALSSLSLSMAEDLSLPMLLKLRNNAVACDRAEQNSRRALEANRKEAASRFAFYGSETSQPALQQAAGQAQQNATEAHAAATPETAHEAESAVTAAGVATDIAANLHRFAPEERRSAEIWVAILNGSVNGLVARHAQSNPGAKQALHRAGAFG